MSRDIVKHPFAKTGVAVGLGRYVVDAVVLEGRSPTELARSHGISRTWIYELVKRFRRGGYEALEPRSRRPHTCPHQHGRGGRGRHPRSSAITRGRRS